MPFSDGNDFDTVRESARRSGAPIASFTDRLAARQHDLPTAMRRIVDVIEEEPHLFTEGTITELAVQAGVAPSSVTRLSKELGYASIATMRTAVAREHALRGADQAWTADVGAAFSPADDPRTLLEKLTNAHLQTIRASAAQLDADRLSDLAAGIAVADRVDIYAIGGSANAARMFADRAFRLGVQARVWDEVHAGLVSASFLGPSSVAIGVSRSGRTPEVLQMMRAARSRGARTVAMVGTSASRLASISELTITTAGADNPGSADMTPRYGQGFALDLLFLLIARLDIEETKRHLAATSRSVERHRRELELAEPDA